MHNNWNMHMSQNNSFLIFVYERKRAWNLGFCFELLKTKHTTQVWI